MPHNPISPYISVYIQAFEIVNNVIKMENCEYEYNMFKKEKNKLLLALKQITKTYKVLNFNGKELYVMGIERILKFSAEEVKLELKSGEQLFVLGAGMVITECDKSAIMLTGEIYKVEVLRDA